MKSRDLPARPTVTYQLRLHLPTYWIFAFRFSLPEMRVTGIVGPLNGPGWRETDIEALEYDEAPERLVSHALLPFELYPAYSRRSSVKKSLPRRRWPVSAWGTTPCRRPPSLRTPRCAGASAATSLAGPWTGSPFGPRRRAPRGRRRG